VEKLIQIIEEKKTIKKETGETMSDRVVRYAVPTAEGKLCMHFGHCEEFALIDYDNTQRKVVHSQRLTPPPHEPGILPQWLHEQNVSVVLAGGMGSRAQNLFAQKGIKVVTGAQGENPDELVVACAQGKLDTGENVCDH
jgi:predicted Fe-Mo cluster-binding NifX family protein